jgi:hypothetical protein
LVSISLAIPDQFTPGLRAETLEVTRPQFNAKPVHLLVDSTGLKRSGAGEWLVEKRGTSRRRSWRKLHIGVDADSDRTVTAELTTNDVDDGSQACRGGGPLYRTYSGRALYIWADLLAWAEGRTSPPRRNTAEADAMQST